MANTLTNLIPDFYEALDQVSRELTGFVPAVNRNSNAERAALNQNVRVPVSPSATTATNTPGVTAPNTGDQTIDNVSIAITKSKHVPVRFDGEERLGLANAGTFANIRADRFANAIRALNNEIEADLWAEAYKNASRAVGTAGTAPFNTANDLSDLANVRRVLEENGCPMSDAQIVFGHAAMANMRGKQAVLFRVNEAGSTDMLRNGMTDRLMGFAIRASNAVGVHTKGSGTLYDINQGGGEAIGQTTLTLDGGTAGASGILAGDVVTFAGDTNNYIVGTGLNAATGDIVINKPGLRIAAGDTVEMTIGNSYTANVAFARSAIVLATRAPALPEGGDSAVDVATVVDPLTGMAYEVAHYKQYLQSVYHVRLAWGVKAIKQEHIAVVMG